MHIVQSYILNLIVLIVFLKPIFAPQPKSRSCAYYRQRLVPAVGSIRYTSYAVRSAITATAELLVLFLILSFANFLFGFAHWISWLQTLPSVPYRPNVLDCTGNIANAITKSRREAETQTNRFRSFVRHSAGKWILSDLRSTGLASTRDLYNR